MVAGFCVTPPFGDKDDDDFNDVLLYDDVEPLSDGDDDVGGGDDGMAVEDVLFSTFLIWLK